MRIKFSSLLCLGFSICLGCGPLLPCLGEDPTPTMAPAFPEALAKFGIRPDETFSPLSIVSVNFPRPDWNGLRMQVITDEGQRVGTQIIWSAPNSPTTLVFDSSSGAKHYNLLVGLNYNPERLKNSQAGVWMETRQGDNQPVEDWSTMIKKWSESPRVLGRTIINGMAEGGNRFGIEQPLYMHLLGWFENDRLDQVTITVNSFDHCFVLLDGKPIISFPKLNQASVYLAGGPHSLEYFGAHTDSQHTPISAAVAIKSPQQWNNLDENSHFFLRCGRAQVDDYQAESTNKNFPSFSFEYINTEQSILSPDDPDHAFISMQFWAFPIRSDYTYVWLFDDGTTATGQNINHTFLRPGNHLTQLAVCCFSKGSTDVLQQSVGVHLDPARLTQEEPQLKDDQKEDFLTRKFSKLSPDDLADAVVLLETYDQVDELAKVVPYLTPKLPNVSETDLPYLLDAGEKLCDNSPEHEAIYAQFFPALLDRCTKITASSDLADRARLSLALFDLATSDDLVQIDGLLKAINSQKLAEDKNRSFQILRADWELASDHISQAKASYELLNNQRNMGSPVRLTGRIKQARAFINQNDFQSAETALAEVRDWEPGVILQPDWELTRLNLYVAEKQMVKAYVWAKRLLKIVSTTDSDRPGLLYQMASLSISQNDISLTTQVLGELQKSYPYSEELAKSRSKWPEKFNGGP